MLFLESYTDCQLRDRLNTVLTDTQICGEFLDWFFLLKKAEDGNSCNVEDSDSKEKRGNRATLPLLVEILGRF